MVKRISIYQISEGTDPEEFWEYHKKVHAADTIRVSGPRLKKYVINRVISSHPVSPEISEEPKFFVIVETWWENEEVMDQAYKEFTEVKVASGKILLDDFLSKVSWGVAAKVDEFVAKDIT